MKSKFAGKIKSNEYLKKLIERTALGVLCFIVYKIIESFNSKSVWYLDVLEIVFLGLTLGFLLSTVMIAKNNDTKRKDKNRTNRTNRK